MIAVSDRESMFDPGPSYYMEKIAVGPEAVGSIDITASPTQNLRWIAKAKRESVRDLTVVILDRPRHAELIDEVRASGARIRLITDGDIFGSIAAGSESSGVDVLMGVGGTPEGVISAAALKCMGGEMQGRLWPRDDDERAAITAAGLDPSAVLTTDDLVRGDNCFFAATGITDGPLLDGVRFDARGVTTQSLVMRRAAARSGASTPTTDRQAPGVQRHRLHLMVRAGRGTPSRTHVLGTIPLATRLAQRASPRRPT